MHERRFFVTFPRLTAYNDSEGSDSVKRIRCNLIGIIAFSFGFGVLIGGLLPSWIIVWILGIALLFLGVLLQHS